MSNSVARYATAAGVSYSALPITINQCPTAGACDTSYATEAAYASSPDLSGGNPR